MHGEGDVMSPRETRRRDGRLAAVVTVQSLILAACLAVTLYFCWLTRQDKDIYIQFDLIGAFSDKETLTFSSYENNGIDLGDNNRTISVSCTGPYIWHMRVCCKGLDEGIEGSGVLELQLMGQKTLSNFTLQGDGHVCRELHSIVYLKSKEEVELRFFSPGNDLRINNVTLGFIYLLRSQCLE